MFGERKSAFGSVGDEAEEIFLNLTPMIDIMTCLLFFLLLSFGAVIIALVNASVPVIADGDPDPTVSKTKVTMGLSITEKGFLVTASHDKMSEEELNKMKRFFPVKGKEHDYQGLGDYLYTVKKQFPNSSSIVITPKPGVVSYEVLIKAMDASRERPVVIRNRPIKLPLFPEAVVSTIVE
jgi:biopolymer transport protein ExbD